MAIETILVQMKTEIRSNLLCNIVTIKIAIEYSHTQKEVRMELSILLLFKSNCARSLLAISFFFHFLSNNNSCVLCSRHILQIKVSRNFSIYIFLDTLQIYFLCLLILAFTVLISFSFLTYPSDKVTSVSATMKTHQIFRALP